MADQIAKIGSNHDTFLLANTFGKLTGLVPIRGIFILSPPLVGHQEAKKKKITSEMNIRLFVIY